MGSVTSVVTHEPIEIRLWTYNKSVADMFIAARSYINTNALQTLVWLHQMDLLKGRGNWCR